MERWLYILCEGELDEMFYERIAERTLNIRFTSSPDLRVRRGSNWKTALAAARLLISKVKHWQSPQAVGIIIAVDNDRCPGHPGTTPYPKPLPAHDRKKGPRYPELRKVVEEALGPDRSQWPVDVAFAVPVEMIESWVLTLLDPSKAASLPPFAASTQHTAREYYGKNPPPQLKELRDAEAAKNNEDLLQLFWRAAEADLEAASAASRSLAMFLEDLKQWRPM